MICSWSLGPDTSEWASERPVVGWDFHPGWYNGRWYNGQRNPKNADDVAGIGVNDLRGSWMIQNRCESGVFGTGWVNDELWVSV